MKSNHETRLYELEPLTLFGLNIYIFIHLADASIQSDIQNSALLIVKGKGA